MEITMTKGKNGPSIFEWKDGKIVKCDKREFINPIRDNESLYQYLLTRVSLRKDMLELYKNCMGISEEDARRIISKNQAPINESDWNILFNMASGRRISTNIFLIVKK